MEDGMPVLNPLFFPYSVLFFSHKSWEKFFYTNLNSRWESLSQPLCVACCGLFSWEACCLLWRPEPRQTSADGSLFPRQLSAGDGCGAILALQLLWSHIASRLHVKLRLLLRSSTFPTLDRFLLRALSFAECPLAGSACRVQEQDLWVKFFVTVMLPRGIGKEGTSMEEMTLSYWPVGQSVGALS